MDTAFLICFAQPNAKGSKLLYSMTSPTKQFEFRWDLKWAFEFHW